MMLTVLSRRLKLRAGLELLRRKSSSLWDVRKIEYCQANANHLAEVPFSQRAQVLVALKKIDWLAWQNFCRPLCTLFLKNPISFVAEHHIGGGGEFNNVFKAKSPSKRIKLAEELFLKSLVSIYHRGLEIKETELLQGTTATDLRAPHEWYPEARSMVRKVVFHCGPTNSGKTYHALKRLAEVEEGGLYCGPLRLLAHEVYEKLNKQGVVTDLRTGQEIREEPGATHVSSTIEMVNLHARYSLAVIDEVQMAGDLQRGDTWTRAVLGVQAEEVHLCGGREALPIVESLLAPTQDVLEVIHYERGIPLKMEAESLKGDYSKVQAGDCIVAFSKAEIFSIRQEIEEKTNYKCAVVFGQLPPETRVEQAKLFNEENTGYDILVASDAIGMGLNLNIRRIVFHTTAKFIPIPKGEVKMEFIAPSQIKQIAGRAGRMASKYDEGYVTAWQEVDLAYVRAVMEHDVPPMKTSSILPSQQQVLALAHYLDRQKLMKESDEGEVEVGIGSDLPEEEEEDKIELVRLLKLFLKGSQVSDTFHLGFTAEMLNIAELLDAVPLTLGDKYFLTHAPLGKSEMEEKMFVQWMQRYAEGQDVHLDVTITPTLPSTPNEFQSLCEHCRVLDLYLWLEIHYPMQFCERELCLTQRGIALYWINQFLHHRPAANGVERTRFAHDTFYKDSRKSLRAKVPAEQHPHIQDTTWQHMKKVAREDLVLMRGCSVPLPNKLESIMTKRERKQSPNEAKQRGDFKGPKESNESKDCNDSENSNGFEHQSLKQQPWHKHMHKNKHHPRRQREKSETHRERTNKAERSRDSSNTH